MYRTKNGLDMWPVPREWVGEKCFIIGGGHSVKEQVKQIAQIKGRIIAIKQAVALRPYADVMFCAARDDPDVCKDYFPLYCGPRIVVRRRWLGFPPSTENRKTLYMSRLDSQNRDRLSDDPYYVGGLDAGASAINLAYLFGANPIVVLGLDMCGTRWVKNHPMPTIPKSHFNRHIAGLGAMSKDLENRGITVYNCSPISKLTCFERRVLDDFLH